MSVILLVVLVVLVATLATLLTFAHPTIPFAGLAIAVCTVPFADVPLLPVGVVIAMCTWCWAALATEHFTWRVPSAPVVAVAVLIVLSGLSMLGTSFSADGIRDFARWAIPASVVYPLSLLSSAERIRIGRTFGYGATLAAAAGILLLLVNPSSSWVARAGLTGTDPNGNARVVLNPGGSSLPRLTATFLDPNVAALLMSFGLLVALALLTGRRRVLCSAVLTVAIALTLSRSAMGAIAVGGAFLVLGSGLRPVLRRQLGLLGLVACAFVLALPGTMSRLRGSFSSADVGSSQRRAALAELPDRMHGHWLLGRGWGLPELLDGSVARVSNPPANASLLALYRGGIFVGVAFTVVLVLLLVAGWRLLRRDDFGQVVLGAGTLGLVLVAFQLDYPVVTMAPAIVVLGVLLIWTSAPPEMFGNRVTRSDQVRHG